MEGWAKQRPEAPHGDRECASDSDWPMGLEDEGWLKWVVREPTLGDLNLFGKG